MYEDSDRDYRSDNNGSAIAPLLRLVALGVLLGGAWHCVSRTHQRRFGGRSARLPERLQTWEGEGGRPEPAEAGIDVDRAPAGPNPA